MDRFPERLKTWLDLVTLLVLRDLRVRYRGSVLGYLWSMMNPLLYMSILTFVFSHIVRFKVEHYAAFVLSGILVWNLFSQSVGGGAHSIVNNGALLRKVKVPKSIFPAAAVCSVLVNFVLALVPYAIIATVTGLTLTPWLLLLPVLLVPYVIFVYGMALFVGSLNVRFRDVGHVIEPLLAITFYATPVIYPPEELPEQYRQLLDLNPMTHFVGAFRSILYYGQAPSAATVGAALFSALVAALLGVSLYRLKRDRFIYEL